MTIAVLLVRSNIMGIDAIMYDIVNRLNAMNPVALLMIMVLCMKLFVAASLMISVRIMEKKEF